MSWQRIVEERIRQAFEDGDFENLAGMGKPIDWGPENPYCAEWQLAFNVMRNAGVAPSWVALDAGLRQQVGDIRRALAEARRRWPQGGPNWELACRRLGTVAARHNQGVLLRNLMAPAAVRPMFRLEPQAEIERVSADPGIY